MATWADTFVGARVYDSGNITINNSTVTKLTFDSERYDTDTIHSTVANTGRLTCNTDGVYLIIANIYWENLDTDGLRMMTILLNNATDIAIVRASPPTALSFGQVITTIYELSATDYVEVKVLQDSGSAEDILASANVSPEFMMSRIG